MRWTRAALLTRALACGRRSRVVLTPRRWRQASQKYLRGDGDKKARSPGRARRKPLKPLRREGRVFRWTCGDALACFLHFARGAAGAAGTRLSLRPLIFGRIVLAQLGRIMPREGGRVFYRPLRAKRSNPCGNQEARGDCFASLAMTVLRRGCLKFKSGNTRVSRRNTMRRPGLEPGPITTNVDVARCWSRRPVHSGHGGYGSRPSPG